MTDEQKQLRLAYRSVFGVEGHRKQAQKLVWEDLVRTNLEQKVFQTLEGGGYDPLAAALNEGGRRVVRNLKGFVELTPEEKEQQKPKAKK
jgi:hypothetical protein